MSPQAYKRQLAQQREHYAEKKNDPVFMAKKREQARRNRAARDNSWTDRDRNLRKLYGITINEFEMLSAAQDNNCAACGEPPLGKGPRSVLAVDHDHNTGKVRGLLCASCNNALGYVNDSVARLHKLVEYLENS